jgi:mannose/fructose/N-acetylgalactosamine-specific phosphotransferase system component IID
MASVFALHRAVLIEASWEVVENTPSVIDRYRATTAPVGYSGDSILNSVSDILMMALGFLLARKLPVWAAVLLVVALEVIPLFAIRDNLTLNILTLISPSIAPQAWQAGG